MGIETRSGTLDSVTEQGIVLGGERLSYSKWFEGPRPEASALGRVLCVRVDAGEKFTFLKRVLTMGEPSPGWKPPEIPPKGSTGGGFGRFAGRFSPEELTLKREEGLRIARSVAIDRALTMAEKGIPFEKVADLASAVEAWLLRGVSTPAGQPVPAMPVPPPGVHPAGPTPPSLQKAPPLEKAPAPPAPRPAKKAPRLEPRAVSSLFNEALRGKLVAGWPEFREVLSGLLGHEVKDPYRLSLDEYAQVKGFFERGAEPRLLKDPAA